MIYIYIYKNEALSFWILYPLIIIKYIHTHTYKGFPGGSVVKNPPVNARDAHTYTYMYVHTYTNIYTNAYKCIYSHIYSSFSLNFVHMYDY